ncbi:hypothetical protein [Flavobacterium sp. CS20]|uniref:hypothetical protein n=1 Tax=Flavobacterium sp. CS20 TaxID=2775246 RepID=UPI001B3A4354|nr:hypothetical protein [Flavobacterium sp. CS20]QTY26815.1 hypothetical protein IGB25_13210 [Flavobacterium sp. CS20]
MNVTRYFTNTVQNAIVLILFLMISATSVFSQGAWDIKYIPLDSLSPELIGKEVRIDFKTSVTDTLQGEVKALDIRKLLSKKDTVSLVLGGELVKFKESWKLYVDHGALREQTLERVETTGDERIYISEMYLGSIDEVTLTLEVVVCKPSGKSKESVIVNKSNVKGFLLRI